MPVRFYDHRIGTRFAAAHPDLRLTRKCQTCRTILARMDYAGLQVDTSNAARDIVRNANRTALLEFGPDRNSQRIAIAEALQQMIDGDDAATTEVGTQVAGICRKAPRRIARRTLPAIVITATDQRFLRGAYAMVWTLLRQHDVPVRVYDLGIDREGPMVRQMQSWGVEFKRIDVGPAHHKIKGWQTWNKPVYCLDAARDHDRVIWLDADVTVGGDLTPMLTESFFIADHGTFQPVKNPNRPEFHERFGPPRRTWGAQYPCAGVFSFDRSMQGLLQEWLAIVRVVVADETLRSGCRFFDQNCLQDLVECDLQDGRIWNNFQVRRTGTEQEILSQTYDYRHIISHFGGRTKPWFRWPQQIDWGTPF